VQDAVYNSPIPRMVNPVSRATQGVGVVLLILPVFLSLVSGAYAIDSRGSEQQLARKVAAITGPGAIALSFENRSSLSKKEADAITGRLRADLESLGVRDVTPDQAAATVTVTLSENPTSFIWVAQIHLGAGESSLAMVSFPRGEGASFTRESMPVTLREVPLWVQEDRILDIAVLEEDPPPNPAAKYIAVLDSEKLSLYRLQGGKWKQEQALSISHSRPWPRDLRGRLIAAKDHLLDAYLPGVRCHLTAALPLALTCRESDDPWPLSGRPLSLGMSILDSPSSGTPGGASSRVALLSAFLAPTRNFFTGALAPGVGKFSTVPKFYSAAPLPRDKYVLWLFASVDGQVHLLDGVTDQVARLDWGSDVASINTSCGSGWQVIATGSANSAGDSVRAYEFVDRDPVAVSAAAEFSGEITALWTEISGETALVVVRNQRAGNYEAFRLAAACSQ
jgi:hypothetical protein